MDDGKPGATMNETRLIKQGLNWVMIVDASDLIEKSKEVLTTVYPFNYAPFTSAKGDKSRQYYLTNPEWMPREDHHPPNGWDSLSNDFKKLAMKNLINHGTFPDSWKGLDVKSSWTVIGEEGSYHTVHEHGYNHICSVTYLEVTEPSPHRPDGQIYFVMHGEGYNEMSRPTFRVLPIQPQKGMMVIFPSWMLHGVYPQGPGIRQTLNIDFGSST